MARTPRQNNTVCRFYRLLLLLNLLNHVAHESATKQDCRLIQLVMLIAQGTHTACL